MNPAYPTTNDLSTAAWLKQFAARLPDYTTKYEIEPAEVAAMQSVADSFLDGLGEQLFRVTLAIRVLATTPGSWPAAAIPWQPAMRMLPQQAAALSYRILSHPAYDPADGAALGLECEVELPVASPA